MKKALITGITGQDGSYLAELLLEKGYFVHGLVRLTSSNLERISHFCHDARLQLHKGDLADAAVLKYLVKAVQPDEIYHLAAPSHINDFLDDPESAADSVAMGTIRLLEAIRLCCPSARFFQANSSELFGQPRETPQTELTSMIPRSLYGIAKQHAFWTVDYYRRVYHLFACSGILFNHESPRRKETFVSRKIILAIARIHAGLQEKLILGNLETQRDWGYAKDFVDGMWRMLQLSTPEDFILATGRCITVKKFVELAFLEIGRQIRWEGKGIDEKGIDTTTGKIVVEVCVEFFRPTEEILLVGDASKAQKKLGWMPKTSLKELMRLMLQAEMVQVLFCKNKS